MMKYYRRLSQNGQVAIPKEAISLLSFKSGEPLELVVTESSLWIRKVLS